MAARQLLLAALLSASAGVAGAARDFPLLADVVLDVCGVRGFELAPSSPCQYNILGFATAWSECATYHKTDMKAFGTCLRSCTKTNVCREVCGGGPSNEASSHCFQECQTAAHCVQQALSTSTGLVSAEHEVAACFKHVPSAAPAAAPAAASFLALAKRPRGALLARKAAPVVDYNELFPVGCEVKDLARKKMDLPAPPNGHGSAPIHLPKGAPLEPFFPDMKSMVENRVASATTFSPAWHQAHMNAFSNSEADKGPALPESLQTPNLQAYFEPPPAASGSNTLQQQAENLKTAPAPSQPESTKGWW